MIELHSYLFFIGAVVLLVVAPGPDMVYMLTRTIAEGRKAGIVAAIGINVGAYVHVIAAILGISAILATSSIAFTTLKWMGACYLIWIGIQAMMSKAGPLQLDKHNHTRLPLKTIFWQGFWSDVLNPKVAIFFLAFLPQFIDAGSPNRTWQLLLLGITCNIIAICINMLIVYFASAATMRLRRNQRLANWLNKAMGAVFIALGIRLASEKL